MDTLIRITTGVVFAIIAALVCRGLNCEPFTVGLWTGTFGCIGSNIANTILDDLRQPKENKN